MKYSIIVPTYNRVDELRELIPSLAKQDYGLDNTELVIVDDGSSDSTKEYIQSLALGSYLKYVEQENQGPGAARNLGMSVAQGQYFIFVDSDCIIPSDYLSKIDLFLLKNKPDAFGGPDTYHPSFSPLLKAINYSMTSFLGTGGTRGSEKSVAKFYPRSFNMGFHRKVYETIGQFHKIRHGQDMDYSARIFKAGFDVRLIPDAFVYHKRRTSIKKFFKQIFNWGVARINLSQLHEGLLKPIHLAPALIVVGTCLTLIGVLFKLLPFLLVYIIAVVAVLIALLAFIQSLTMYKNIRVALLSIITLFIQVIAYGLGSTSGLYQRYILGRRESKGYVKNYYK